MFRIRVQYDETTRTFKLVDQKFEVLLEGDAIYDLNIPLMEDEDVDAFIASSELPIAHA